MTSLRIFKTVRARGSGVVEVIPYQGEVIPYQEAHNLTLTVRASLSNSL